jgi:hypothetical protein
MGIGLVGRSKAPSRDLYVGSRLDVAETSELAGPFVAFTALDAAALRDDELRSLARTLLQNGCVYSCSWGPEAGRVETAFDLEAAEAGIAGSPYGDDVVVTTSHEGESLDDALWFALYTAFPASGDEAPVLLAITDDRWRADIEARLGDTDRFNSDVLATEDETGP